jgi:hypothetical protein
MNSRRRIRRLLKQLLGQPIAVGVALERVNTAQAAGSPADAPETPPDGNSPLA